MDKSKKNIVAAAFVLFLALVVIGVSSYVYNTPVELTSVTAGNYACNLMNGGNVLEDEGFLFFVRPNERGIYRTETDNPEKITKISDEGDGFLQVFGSTYYYAAENSLKSCDWDGKNVTTIVEYAKSPMVVGSTVYYLNREGEICKYSMKTEKDENLNVKPENGFVVYYNEIYYSDKNFVRKMSSGGANDEKAADVPATKIAVDGKYMYYISDGYICSARMTSDGDMLSNKIVKAEEFAVIGSSVMYSAEDGLYLADMNDLVSTDGYQPKKILNSQSSVYIDGKYFYFFDGDNKLCRTSSEDGEVENLE